MTKFEKKILNSKIKKKMDEIIIIKKKKEKTCKKVSKTRCTPHNGEMNKECNLSVKNRCVKKKINKDTDINKDKNINSNNKIIMETNTESNSEDTQNNTEDNNGNIKKISCKKVSDSKCVPHDGEMDKGCILTEKNRCIIYDESKNKMKKIIQENRKEILGILQEKI